MSRDLDSIVNSSGFMLQIAIEHAVENSSSRHEFNVHAREHPWRFDGDSGFIDLVLGRSSARLVCECKRSRGGAWVFLVEDDARDLDRGRLHWRKMAARRLASSGWHNFHFTTSAPESSFCIVRGHGENQRPMLETIAARLIVSTEALAAEEAPFLDTAEDGDNFRFYVPLLITTAELWICRYKPDSIALATGDAAGANYEQVPLVYFRKSLTTGPADYSLRGTERELPDRAFASMSREQERTVVVVSAEYLVDLLLRWETAVTRDARGFPWAS